MDKYERIEYVVFSVIVLVLIGGVVFGGQYARKERRDGQVRDGLRQVKHDLEMFYNVYGGYPLEWDAEDNNYVVVSEEGEYATGWYVSGQLENKGKRASGIDEEYNIEWRVTDDGRYEICGGDYRCSEY